MNRRSATWVLRILLSAVAMALPLVAGVSSDAAAHNDTRVSSPRAVITASGDASTEATAPGDTVPDDTVPVDTANPFFPEERDLTDCLGLLQRPGCGSEARGGLGQTLVAIIMIGGLVLIFGRVAWGIRRNRGVLPDSASESDTRPADGRAIGGTETGGASGEAADVTTGGTTDADSGEDAP